jgi:hypothetical protein
VHGGRRGACESQELVRRRCQIWGFRGPVRVVERNLVVLGGWEDRE